MEKIIIKKPESFGENKKEYKYDVIFLMEQLKAKDAIQEFNPREGVDKIYEGENALYISRLINQLTKSHFSKIAESKIYQNITIRNWNTTEKLYKIMEENNKEKI
jgi:uncharacterized protein (DUF1697 family)